MKNLKTSMAPADVPLRGQSFRDAESTWWRIVEVIHSDKLEGFYIVRLAFGATDACGDGILVLARSEFAALVRERGLRVEALPKPFTLELAWNRGPA